MFSKLHSHRQDYMPDDVGRLMGWLFEEASTNSCLQSAAFDNASWITSTAAQTNKGTIDGDQYKSPDGGQNSDVLKSSGAGTGIIAARQQGFTFNNGTTYTVSVYAKKSGQYDTPVFVNSEWLPGKYNIYVKMEEIMAIFNVIRRKYADVS